VNAELRLQDQRNCYHGRGKTLLQEVSAGPAKVMDLQGSPGSESNGSESQNRPGSGIGKEISWLQDELGVETCPSMIPSGCGDRQTPTRE
jgi:hypothetical protein